MKKIIIVPFLLILVAVGVVFWFYQNSQPVSDDVKYVDFLIKRGQSASQIGNSLHEAGLIKSPLAFKIYIQFTGKSGKVQSGEFRLSPSFSLFEIVRQLSKGPVELWVTIPEGLRREEVAKRFSQALGKDEFFEEGFLSLSKNKEGMLFPDTYLFPREASASSIVNRMVDIFDSKVAPLTPTNTSLNSREILILASLIERETKTDEERPVVAGILMNRLDGGWPLQVDAAVQYAVGGSANWWPILTKSDLESPSEFNTYKFTGLPPAPIANPGISSLKAAYSPEINDYWYYIHDPDGVIHYARTLEEHNMNIQKYLR